MNNTNTRALAQNKINRTLEEIKILIENGEEITAPLITSPGAHFKEYKGLRESDIFIRTNNEEKDTNPARFDMRWPNVNLLASSLTHSGQLLSLTLPIVKRIKPLLSNGIVYYYEGVDTHHRLPAAKIAGIENLVFSVYEFDDEESELLFQLKCNDHTPAAQSNEDDLCGALCVAVEKRWIPNTIPAMKQWLKEITNVHGHTINKAIAQAVRKVGTYQENHTYTASDIAMYVDQPSHYEEDTPKLCIGGTEDVNRQSIGWSVKEGYEYEYVMNATKRFHEDKLPSYFLCHTKRPTEKESLTFKREKMRKAFKSLESAMDSVQEYKQEHGTYPWNIEAFLPQSNDPTCRETGFLTE